MNDLEQKYIDLLLKRCLDINKSKSLLIYYDKINKNFIDKLIITAKSMGFNDIYTDEDDIFLLHDKLEKLSLDEMTNDPFFNKNIWNEYALKGANFLMFDTEFPGVMDGIPSEKIAFAGKLNRDTRKIFRDREMKYEMPWCIPALPNEIWAKYLLPNSRTPYDDLFNIICKMCMVDTEDPIVSWNTFISDSKSQINWLNSLKIKTLHYLNSKVTDLTVSMPNNYKWLVMGDDSKNGIIVNMPSYEIFSSPDYRKTNGIVYNSKPLSYNGGIIDDFYIVFNQGKVIDYKAKVGNELLESIINTDDNSCYLGEVALVNYDSPISNTGLIFETTLFDENASCHLALGRGFPNCIKNGEKMSLDELLKHGINQSDTHVDFMIGTEDLMIEAETDHGKQLIFKNGNFINH